jgi:hypothetical protein
MAYEEEEARRSRVVVETPTARREVVHSQSVRTPESGISAGMVGVLVVVAIALITILVLFWMNNQQMTDQNANMVAQQPPPPTVVQTAPAQQPPVIIQQQPAPAAPQQAPIIISPPSGGTTDTSSPNNDASIQAAIDKKFTDDPNLSALGITATVMNAKVTLVGTVKTEAMKSQIEKMVRNIKGVKELDNQITVIPE